MVGFDPRGVGPSAPVKCISDAARRPASLQLDPDARDAFDGAGQRWPGRSPRLRRQVRRRTCSTSTPSRPPATWTLVRQAVGDAKLTYLGYSYGTLLGAVYAQLFPRRVRALVLDGAVDPKAGELASAQTQAAGFERAFNQFAADCKARNAACPIGPDAAGRGEPDPGRGQAVAHSRRQRRPEGHRRAGASRGRLRPLRPGRLGRAGSGRSPTPTTATPAGCSRSPTATTERDDNGHYTNLFDANTAVNCADTAETVPDRTVQQALSPGARSTRCSAAARARPADLPAVAGRRGTRTRRCGRPGRRRSLVVGTTSDPATPYAVREVLARMLGLRAAAHLGGRGAHRLPEDEVRDRRGGRLPRHPHGPGRQRDLRRVLTGLRPGCRPGSGRQSGRQ